MDSACLTKQRISEPSLHGVWHRDSASWGNFTEDVVKSIYRSSGVSLLETCFLSLSCKVLYVRRRFRVCWWKIQHTFCVKDFTKEKKKRLYKRSQKNLILAVPLNNSSKFQSVVFSRTNILWLFVNQSVYYDGTCWQKRGPCGLVQFPKNQLLMKSLAGRCCIQELVWCPQCNLLFPWTNQGYCDQ